MGTDNATDAIELTDRADTSVVLIVGKTLRWLGIAIVIVGPLLTADPDPVLPTDLGTVLAAGAVVLWASTYFELEALKERLGTGGKQRLRTRFSEREGDEQT